MGNGWWHVIYSTYSYMSHLWAQLKIYKYIRLFFTFMCYRYKYNLDWSVDTSYFICVSSCAELGMFTANYYKHKPMYSSCSINPLIPWPPAVNAEYGHCLSQLYVIILSSHCHLALTDILTALHTHFQQKYFLMLVNSLFSGNKYYLNGSNSA